jgi:hypothetical protein
MDHLVIRALTENDYHDTLVGWWSEWGWEAPALDFLPDNGRGGVMVLDGATPICAGFVYITNSKACWVDWIISNKRYTQRDKRREAITLLVSSLTDICKRSGGKYCYALIKSQSLIEVYKELGYQQGDSYNSEMIKTL